MPLSMSPQDIVILRHWLQLFLSIIFICYMWKWTSKDKWKDRMGEYNILKGTSVSFFMGSITTGLVSTIAHYHGVKVK